MCHILKKDAKPLADDAYHPFYCVPIIMLSNIYSMTRPKALFASKTLSLSCLFQLICNYGDWKQKSPKDLCLLKRRKHFANVVS